jgi:hypothetical protein
MRRLIPAGTGLPAEGRVIRCSGAAAVAEEADAGAQGSAISIAVSCASLRATAL